MSKSGKDKKYQHQISALREEVAALKGQLKSKDSYKSVVVNNNQQRNEPKNNASSIHSKSEIALLLGSKHIKKGLLKTSMISLISFSVIVALYYVGMDRIINISRPILSTL